MSNSVRRWYNPIPGTSSWAVAGTAILPPALRLVMDGGRERPLFPAEPGEVAARLDGCGRRGFTG